MNKLELVYGFSAGLVIGGVAGYFITNARLKKVYAERAEEDIRSVKDHYTTLRKDTEEEILTIRKNNSVLRKDGAYSTPGKALDAYRDRVTALGYTEETMEGRNEEPDEELKPDETLVALREKVLSPTVNDQKPLPVVENFIADEEIEDCIDDEDDEEEQPEYAQEEDLDVSLHDPDKPYIISVQEFMDPDPEYGKISITYFSEDDTLIDDREDVIPDVLGTIGAECLLKFGHKSDDPNVVYVRNVKLEADFEIVLDDRAYAEVILGIRQPNATAKRFREDD